MEGEAVTKPRKTRRPARQLSPRTRLARVKAAIEKAIGRPTDTVNLGEPGPGAFSLPNTVGETYPLSTHRKSGTLSFGTAPQRPMPKMDDGPGAGANFSLRQRDLAFAPLSTDKPVKSFSMKRQDESKKSLRTDSGMERLGPGAYNPREFGKHQTPAITIKGRVRYPPPGNARFPAPGAYELHGGIGQGSFGKKRAPAASMGKPPRRKLRSAREEQESMLGPGMYRIPGSMGAQPLSTKRSNAAARITGRPTGPKIKRPAPRIGPGYYKVAEAAGPQALSTKRSAPAPSLAGRTKFGSYI